MFGFLQCKVLTNAHKHPNDGGPVEPIPSLDNPRSYSRISISKLIHKCKCRNWYHTDKTIPSQPIASVFSSQPITSVNTQWDQFNSWHKGSPDPEQLLRVQLTFTLWALKCCVHLDQCPGQRSRGFQLLSAQWGYFRCWCRIRTWRSDLHLVLVLLIRTWAVNVTKQCDAQINAEKPRDWDVVKNREQCLCNSAKSSTRYLRLWCIQCWAQTAS